MRDWKWLLVVALWLAWSLVACRSAVKDFYDPLVRPGNCGGSAGSIGGDAAGGQATSTTSAAGGTAGAGGQGGACP